MTKLPYQSQQGVRDIPNSIFEHTIANGELAQKCKSINVTQATELLVTMEDGTSGTIYVVPGIHFVGKFTAIGSAGAGTMVSTVTCFP